MKAETLTVDLGTETGPFHGGASGTLYGVYGDGVPSRTVIEGMYLRTVTTKAQDGVQHPGADALEILPPFVAAGGKDVYIYVPDLHRGFPYEWPGATGEEKLATYLDRLRRQVEQVRTLGALKSHVVYVPFNEPEGNMFGTGEWSYDGVSWHTEPGLYFAAWTAAHRLIREIDPGTRIAGPNTCVLQPDVITWHELSSPDEVRTNVAKYRAMEQELGIGPLPVNLNEYAHDYHLSVPGQMIQWIAAIEESKVDADMAYWNIAGNLNDSAVEAPAPHPNVPYTLQGVAALDRGKRQARVLFGGPGPRRRRAGRLRHAGPSATAGDPLDRPTRRLRTALAAAGHRTPGRGGPGAVAADRPRRDVRLPADPRAGRQRGLSWYTGAGAATAASPRCATVYPTASRSGSVSARRPNSSP